MQAAVLHETRSINASLLAEIRNDLPASSANGSNGFAVRAFPRDSGLPADEPDELVLGAGVVGNLDGRAEHPFTSEHVFGKPLEPHER